LKALIQRVSEASVTVDDTIVGQIQRGYVVFLGVTHSDTEGEAATLAARTLALRIFPDEQDRMNRSIIDIGGAILVVSQFTLYADTRKGNRPSFIDAAPPDQASALYERYIEQLRRALGPEHVATGTFRARMRVALVNDGPVTIELRS
jgi:D-tyrosyl-tRNA(Tyr) deacylase